MWNSQQETQIKILILNTDMGKVKMSFMLQTGDWLIGELFDGEFEASYRESYI